MSDNPELILSFIGISIGSFLLGSEFGSSVGWAVWLIVLSIR